VDQQSNCIYDLIMMTWDEAKRQENLRKHGIDFVGGEAMFDHPVVA